MNGIGVTGNLSDIRGKLVDLSRKMSTKQKQLSNPCYAIVPAAGSSRRMGRSKLLLPWPRRQSAKRDPGTPPAARRVDEYSPTSTLPSYTVMDSVLEAWTTSRVVETIVVIRSDDRALREACRRWPVTIIHPPQPTLDMKESVCVGLRALLERGVPLQDAGCFISPADLPGLTAVVINGLIDAMANARTIWLPTFGDTLENSRVGHPALLPWQAVQEIFQLGPQEGVNHLIQRSPRELVLFPTHLSVSDVDTPEEYQAALQRLECD